MKGATIDGVTLDTEVTKENKTVAKDNPEDLTNAGKDEDPEDIEDKKRANEDVVIPTNIEKTEVPENEDKLANNTLDMVEAAIIVSNVENDSQSEEDEKPIVSNVENDSP